MGIEEFAAKPITLMNEKNAYRTNNNRMVLLSGEDEKSGATKIAAREEKKPQPITSRANITEPVE